MTSHVCWGSGPSWPPSATTRAWPGWPPSRGAWRCSPVCPASTCLMGSTSTRRTDASQSENSIYKRVSLWGLDLSLHTANCKKLFRMFVIKTLKMWSPKEVKCELWILMTYTIIDKLRKIKINENFEVHIVVQEVITRLNSKAILCHAKLEMNKSFIWHRFQVSAIQPCHRYR